MMYPKSYLETNLDKESRMSYIQSTTLEAALKNIMLFEDRMKSNKKAAAEKILALQKRKLQQEAEEREKVCNFLIVIITFIKF